jgi:hypothetical protein
LPKFFAFNTILQRERERERERECEREGERGREREREKERERELTDLTGHNIITFKPFDFFDEISSRKG